MKALILFFSLSCEVFYNFPVKSIDGRVLDLNKYKGKKVLIVNTASECGYTKQYKELEELYRKYKDKLVVIGFPANNFGSQEPGTNAEIAAFCSKSYEVTFPMSAKISVKGDDADALFKWLTTETNPHFSGDIKWNFEKFLLDENGRLVHRFRSKVKPMDAEIISAIEAK